MAKLNKHDYIVFYDLNSEDHRRPIQFVISAYKKLWLLIKVSSWETNKFHLVHLSALRESLDIIYNLYEVNVSTARYESVKWRLTVSTA